MEVRLKTSVLIQKLMEIDKTVSFDAEYGNKCRCRLILY